METYRKNWFKFILSFVACSLIRLIPFRPPNIEPILASQMPFSRAYGGVAGFLFAFLNIVLYDFITQKLGLWTLLTAVTYGVLGFGAVYFFKKYKENKWNYVSFAVIGTLFFDGITGLSFGPLFYNQPFMEALVGQIPFTLWHLLGNISFAIVLSPSLYKFVITNKKFETSSLVNFLNLKQI